MMGLHFSFCFCISPFPFSFVYLYTEVFRKEEWSLIKQTVLCCLLKQDLKDFLVLCGSVGIFKTLSVPVSPANGSPVIVAVVTVAQMCPTLWNPADCSLPGASVYGFPRQEYWSGFLFPPPGNLADLGIKPASPASAGRFFPAEPPGKPHL